MLYSVQHLCIHIRLDGRIAEEDGGSSGSRERLRRAPLGTPLLAADMCGRRGELQRY